MVDDLDDVIRKVRKLVALSESPNPNEAANAMNKARKLLLEHGLTLDNLGTPPSDIADEEWRSFDPQVIYSCGNFGDLDGLLSRTEWHDVAAVKNSRIFYFPCELTCRVATQTGVFAASLAADIYPQQFSDFHAALLVKAMRGFLGAEWTPRKVELLRLRPR